MTASDRGWLRRHLEADAPGWCRRSVAAIRSRANRRDDRGSVAVLMCFIVLLGSSLATFLVDAGTNIKAANQADTYSAEAARSASIAVGPVPTSDGTSTLRAAAAAKDYLIQAGVTNSQVTVVGPADRLADLAFALPDAAAVLRPVAELGDLDRRKRDRDQFAAGLANHLAVGDVLAQVALDLAADDLLEPILITLDFSDHVRSASQREREKQGPWIE